MSQLKKLERMRLIVDMKYRSTAREFSKLLEQETELRHSLTKLDQYCAENENKQSYGQRVIGADVIWQSWVGRKKQDINHRLAQTLAKKELHREQVRLAYGKVLATRELTSPHITQARKRKIESQLASATK